MSPKAVQNEGVFAKLLQGSYTSSSAKEATNMVRLSRSIWAKY